MSHLPTYEAKWKILLQKFFFRLSDFFYPWKAFVIKSGVEFGLFPEKIGNLSGLLFSDLGERKSNSGFAANLNVFVKNAINSFILDVQYKKKLLITFSSEILPLEVIGGSCSLSLVHGRCRMSVPKVFVRRYSRPQAIPC